MLLIQAVISPLVIRTPPGLAAVEQVSQGARAPAVMVSSFDGLGLGFEGPQGSAAFRNPSDNSLAVGRNHVAVIRGRHRITTIRASGIAAMKKEATETRHRK